MKRAIGDRGGFTLVELLLVAILGGLIVAATYQVLITNQRTYTANTAQIHDQQTLRAGLDILFGELREISTEGGDLLLMHPRGLRIRTMRAFGLVCDVQPGLSPPRITALRVGRWFEGGDSLFIFYDNDTELVGDDVWLSKVVSNVDTTATCPGGDQAQEMHIPGLSSTDDSVRIGAPVRTYTTFTYGILQDGADWYLARAEGYRTPEPLIGPIRSSTGGGVEFVYLDEDGNVTGTATDVAQIQVTLRTLSGIRDAQGNFMQDSITATVSVRN
jgi:prepilin-type N-terminal cleavage/methylation domain-containing protein